jgi:regulator of sigma E protease
MEWVSLIGSGICVALFFSLAIFIHEFGHFIAARRLGLRVDAFSIGFGPALWKRTVGGVVYKVGCVPFGGYVALPQLDPSGMEKVQGSERDGEGDSCSELEDIAPWKRIVVALAGPVGNFVLAIFLAYFLFLAPGVKTGVLDTRIGSVAENSEAWKAGVRPGDRILSVNNRKVGTWSDLQVECQLAGDSGKAVFGIQRGDTVREVELPFRTSEIVELKMLEGVFPATHCEVSALMPDMPAIQAGLLPNDVVVEINGEPVREAQQFAEAIQHNRALPVTLTVKRGRELQQIVLTPRFDEASGRYLVGIVWKDATERVRAWMMYRNPWRQLKWDSLSVVRVLQALLAPESKGERKAVARNVGGPVAIVIGLFHTVRGDILDAIGFLRMICVNLAILNLLPFPVLDGGHILFALYEVTTRRKPHPKVVSALVNAFAFLLIGLMVLLFYRDIARQVKISRAVRAAVREARQEAETASETNASVVPR